MRAFAEILKIAADRHGGVEAVEEMLSVPRPRPELLAIPDDRWLSKLSFAVFAAGFNWKVVQGKWPGFEEAFHGFDVGRCLMMEDEEIEKAAKAGGIPHMPKARAVRDNAALFRALADAHGSAAMALVDGAAEDLAGLLLMLKKRGGRLGGSTSQYFLRMMGVDGYLISEDVGKALIREGVVERPPTSQKAMAATEAAFRAWAAESGRPLMQVSRVLALSTG